MYFLQNVTNILMTPHALGYVLSKLPGFNRKYVNTGQKPALCRWSREVCNPTSGIDLARAHATGKMRIAVQEADSTVVQIGACLWPPGRMGRKSAFLLHTLSILEAHEEKIKPIYLAFPSFWTLHLSFLLLLFVEHTHIHKPRCSSAVQRRRYSEGSWMDGWHLHALIECMFAQYFSAADGFIRHIDLEGR